MRLKMKMFINESILFEMVICLNIKENSVSQNINIFLNSNLKSILLFLLKHLSFNLRT